MRTIDSGGMATIATLMGVAALVATLDALFAISFWAARGVAPMRILQSIAAGVQGAAAFKGGVASALLGLGLHFLIATCMVLGFYLASRQWPALLRFPLWAAMAYGLFLYIVMNRVVVPLSAAPSPRPGPIDWPWVLSSIVVHVLCVGLPCVLVARRLLSPLLR